MSTKNVKITNGKILNYKISATGYKTIYGSQLITDDTTINKNMIAEIDPNGVYSLGDRIGGIASFVCYFNSTNPETNVDTKYAVFVLDAQYRAQQKHWGDIWEQELMPCYTTSSEVLAAKESATYNTNIIVNKGSLSSYPAFEFARSAATITVNGIQYQSQLPNAYEIENINNNRLILDTFDNTLSTYSANSLSNWGVGTYNYAWTSMQYNDSNAWKCSTGGVLSSFTKGNSQGYGEGACFIIPVFEIPVN